MQEQMKERLMQFMDKALGGIEAGVDFMSAQLPDFVEQLLRWHLTWSICVMFILGGLGIFIIKKLIKVDWSVYEDWHPPVGIVGGIATAFCIVTAVSEFKIALQILIAPKVWLLEYVTKLV